MTGAAQPSPIGGRCLSWVTPDDRVTIHNAFPTEAFGADAPMKLACRAGLDSLHIDLAEHTSVGRFPKTWSSTIAGRRGSAARHV